jgi:hypothetical protein
MWCAFLCVCVCVCMCVYGRVFAEIAMQAKRAREVEESTERVKNIPQILVRVYVPHVDHLDWNFRGPYNITFKEIHDKLLQSVNGAFQPFSMYNEEDISMCWRSVGGGCGGCGGFVLLFFFFFGPVSSRVGRKSCFVVVVLVSLTLDWPRGSCVRVLP